MTADLLLDSSAWIELFNSGALLKACQRELQAAEKVIVPTTVLYEVYRKVASLTSDDQGLSAVTVLTQHSIADLSSEVALLAADLSLQYGLGMADSIVLAHAQHADARLVTLDNDFAAVPGVKVLRKGS